MKGYLKGSEGLFQLAPRVTTVGRDGCDLVLRSQGIDLQHAVVEYSEQEQCFVLQDLNTQQGTYVNDCRVQNAAVRLAPGDLIRFGGDSTSYELQVDNIGQVSYPPVSQRLAWTQPLTIISDIPTPPIVYHQSDTLPALSSVMKSTTTTWGQQSASNQLPRPPPVATIRTRPLSAGSATIASRRIQAQSSSSPPVQHRASNGSGWVTVNSSTTRQFSSTNSTDVTSIQEKEQRILRLQEELRRLSLYENECGRKDDIIQTLREEIAELQGRLRHAETSRGLTAVVSTDQELTEKLIHLESEVSMKRLEIQSLQEQISEMKDQDSGPVSRTEVNEKIMEINSLRQELERTRKDKNITSGLVTQMQKDMTSKDTTISRLTREIENLKKDCTDKNVMLTSMQSKFKQMDENRKINEDVELKEKELATFKLKFKSSENRLQEQSDLISELRAEIEKMKASEKEEKESYKKLQIDVEQTKSKCTDIERAERQVRVDLEQLSKRLERFRNRVIQVTFSTPGIKAPTTEIDDDELLDTLKKIIEERTELTRQVQDLKENVSSAHSVKRDMLDSTKKLKQQLNETVLRLNEGGRLTSKLKQEADLIRTISLDEDFVWLKDSILDILQGESEWENEIEAALEQCGVNVRLSEDGPWHHIRELREKHMEVISERAKLIEAVEGMDEMKRSEQQQSLDNLREELENEKRDECERIKLESEERLNRMIDEIRLLEAEKRDNSVLAEREKVAELEANIESLKMNLLSKDEEDKSNRESTLAAVEQIESYQKLEVELREQISRLEKSKETEIEAVRVELTSAQKKVDDGACNYQEQIRQHSVTICAMEERLNKVMKKNKDYQSEITTLKTTIQDLQARANRPIPHPPKPRVVIQKPAVDVVALEQNISGLRMENVELKKQVNESQSVIAGLRRDLTGASARLSDITGELSESQKEEIEKSRILVQKKEIHVVELKQQMAKLSEIIDKQAGEIKNTNIDVEKQKTAIAKYKNIVNEKESKLRELEESLIVEQNKRQENIQAVHEEGRIHSEMSAAGAQCRGERHEQVIQRQREALTELRARMKDFEQLKPPIPNHDQALQQVIMLKKEVAELRAQQATTNTPGMQVAQSSMVEEQIRRIRGATNQEIAAGEVERSAHRETLESLELSETSYLTLLRAISSSLDLTEAEGLRSMAHLQRDERQRLMMQREKTCEMLASRIKVLTDRIGRKDELLQGYENDLAKLQQAETLANKRGSQVDSLTTDVMGRTEEIQYLRETLQRTRDRLDQEKRLNSAIKSKKTFHMENERPPSGKKKAHHCPPDDIFGKETAKKKAAAEKIKRRNYEIRVLKGELSKKSQDLSQSKRRIMTMEQSNGIEVD